MKILYPHGKPCKCGCGKQAARNIGPDGRNRGWNKYAKGHQPPPALTDPAIVAKAHRAKRRKLLKRVPYGSCRIRTIQGKQYYQIKVRGRRRWVYEHRWIIEQELGRKLRRDEHVHHKDDNGLSNKRSNLKVLSPSAHARVSSRFKNLERCVCRCPNCGASLSHFKKLGPGRWSLRTQQRKPLT